MEVKKAEIGENTKVGHLTYVGDATLGKDINVGCGVIYSNFDGVRKFHTTVGDKSFIGAGSTLVSPINVADHAFIAADSTITKDVGKYEMAIAGAGRSTRKTTGTSCLCLKTKNGNNLEKELRLLFLISKMHPFTVAFKEKLPFF